MCKAHVQCQFRQSSLCLKIWALSNKAIFFRKNQTLYHLPFLMLTVYFGVKMVWTASALEVSSVVEVQILLPNVYRSPTNVRSIKVIESFGWVNRPSAISEKWFFDIPNPKKDPKSFKKTGCVLLGLTSLWFPVSCFNEIRVLYRRLTASVSLALLATWTLVRVTRPKRKCLHSLWAVYLYGSALLFSLVENEWKM